MDNISWSDFSKIQIHVGTIIDAKPFHEAKKPAYQLYIDFGVLGIRKSSAQITAKYCLEELIGKQVTAVLNFPPKQIANFMSACLVLGIVDDNQEVTLICPDKPTKNGLRIS